VCVGGGGCVGVCMGVWVGVYICVCIYIYIYIYMCVCVYICVIGFAPAHASRRSRAQELVSSGGLFSACFRAS
jgi:hypothetical protein